MQCFFRAPISSSFSWPAGKLCMLQRNQNACQSVTCTCVVISSKHHVLGSLSESTLVDLQHS